MSKITAHLLKDIFTPKFNHLMDCAEHQKAISFALDTKQIALDTLEREESAELRSDLDAAISRARIARYDAKWDVDLNTELEKQ